MFLGNLAGGRAGAAVGSRGHHLLQCGSAKRRAEIDRGCVNTQAFDFSVVQMLPYRPLYRLVDLQQIMDWAKSSCGGQSPKFSHSLDPERPVSLLEGRHSRLD